MLANGAIEGFEWLCKQRSDLNINLEDTFDAIWQDVETPAMKKLCAFVCFRNLCGDDDDELEIAASLLEKYPYDVEHKKNYGFDDLVHYLADEGEEISFSDIQRTTEIVVERCGLAAVQNFLGTHSDIVVSDTLIQAAEKNVIANRDELKSLLEKQRVSGQS